MTSILRPYAVRRAMQYPAKKSESIHKNRVSLFDWSLSSSHKSFFVIAKLKIASCTAVNKGEISETKSAPDNNSGKS